MKVKLVIMFLHYALIITLKYGIIFTRIQIDVYVFLFNLVIFSMLVAMTANQ